MLHESLEVSPNHLGAYIQISSCLDQLGQSETAQLFSRRAGLLSEVDRNYNVLRASFTQQTALETVAMLGELGRFWEAAGWCFVMTNLDEPSPRSQPEFLKWLARIHTRPSQHTALELPTVRYPPNAPAVYEDSVNWPGVGYNFGNNNPMSSAHTGGIQVLLGDGTVRFLSNNIDMLTLRLLCTRDDGRVLGDF